MSTQEQEADDMLNKTSWERVRYMMSSKWRAVMAAGIVLVCAMLAGCWLFTNVDPVAVFTADPQSGVAPLSVSLDAQASSDSDGTIVSYEWTFGDGQSGVGQVVVHIYTAAGTYTARLTVTDDDGASASSSQTISVTSSDTPTATWTKIWEPVSTVILGMDTGTGTELIYAVDSPAHDIYKYSGGTWTKVGGPGSMFVVAGTGKLYGLTENRQEVKRYDGASGWVHVGGAASEIYGAIDQSGPGLYGRSPGSGDLIKYTGTGWRKIYDYNDAGTTIAAFYAFGSHGKVYGLFDGIPYRYDGTPLQWTQIGGPAWEILAAENVLYAVDPVTRSLWQYDGTPSSWTMIGLPSKTYAVGDDDHLYSVSPDGSGVYRYLGTPLQWEQIGDFAVEDIYAVGDVLLAVTAGARLLMQYQAP